MRKNLGAKAYTYPQPVFILAAYGKDGTPNAMNAAWGGISDDKELTMCISASHKTTEDILAKKAFTVSMADIEHVAACCFKEWGRSCCDQRNCLSGYSLPRYWTCS